MKCTLQKIHELTEEARRGNTAVAVEICRCFMPEIMAMVPRQTLDDVVQEVLMTLICEIRAQKERQS